MKLVVFDLDGVLVDIDSSWQLIHRSFGTDNEKNFQRHLKGEIDYKEFMRSDIELWGRVNINRVKSILDRAAIMTTAPNVINNLKIIGFKTAIISSGISILAERVKETLDLDYAFANRLLVDDDGWLTGEGEETVKLLNKDSALKKLLTVEDVSIKQCAVIGDSQFDIPLFKGAGLSIAFNAKDETVKHVADLVIEGKDLTKILPWLTSKNLIKFESSLKYSDAKEAIAVVNSVSPDNLRTPFGLNVKTYCEGKIVKIKGVCIKGVGTLLSTLDDLFACIQIAEKTIKTTKPI